MHTYIKTTLFGIWIISALLSLIYCRTSLPFIEDNNYTWKFATTTYILEETQVIETTFYNMTLQFANKTILQMWEQKIHHHLIVYLSPKMEMQLPLPIKTEIGTSNAYYVYNPNDSDIEVKINWALAYQVNKTLVRFESSLGDKFLLKSGETKEVIITISRGEALSRRDVDILKMTSVVIGFVNPNLVRRTEFVGEKVFVNSISKIYIHKFLLTLLPFVIAIFSSIILLQWNRMKDK